MGYNKKKDLTGKVAKEIDKIRHINFKELFGGIPKSVIKFMKDKELMKLIDYDNSEIGKVEGDAKARGSPQCFTKEMRK